MDAFSLQDPAGDGAAQFCPRGLPAPETDLRPHQGHGEESRVLSAVVLFHVFDFFRSAISGVHHRWGGPKNRDRLLLEDPRFGTQKDLRNAAESPQKAIISLKNDRGTSYDTYISIQNELKAAYATLRDAEAYKISGGSMKTYEEISTCAEPEDEIYNNQKQCKQWKDAIKASIPMVISEAEPKNVGGTE